ncbi:YceI family protein [bacterium]|nr:YceI family protein [bacterium]
MRRMLKIAVVTLASVLATSGPARAEMFIVNDPNGRDNVKFESHAPLENIIGLTSQIRGEIVVDPADVAGEGTRAKFWVDLASMKTGIGLRDQHMRENFLHTDKHPQAVFTLTKITSGVNKALKPGEKAEFIADGLFELHGIEKSVRVPVSVVYLKESDATKAKMPGDLIRIQTRFRLSLPDYGIEVPEMLFMKLDKNVDIDIDALASTKNSLETKPAAANPCNPCNPCGGKKSNPCNPCNPCGGKKR